MVLFLYILQTITLAESTLFRIPPIPLNQTCIHTRIGERNTMQHSTDVLKESVLKFQLCNES